MPIHIFRNTTIANHLISSGYGSWLSNDPRGSGSVEVRKPALRVLGPAHFGRRIIQPSRQELRAFHRQAEPLLDYDVSWFEAEARAVIAAAVERVIAERGYTCYSFAVGVNHMHLLNRTHRDSGREMWFRVTDATRSALRACGLFSDDHPVWSSRPYVVFKQDVQAVWNGVGYIEENPLKEGLPRQIYPWVQPYDGWPYHKRR